MYAAIRPVSIITWRKWKKDVAIHLKKCYDDMDFGNKLYFLRKNTGKYRNG